MAKPTPDILKVLPNLNAQAIVDIIQASPGWEDVIDVFVKQDQEKEDEAEQIEYPEDPVEFIEQVLGYTLTDKQKEVCWSIISHRNTVISSGHSVGKSFLSAAIACWWLVTRKNSIVVTLAPSFNQVQNILWRYLRYMVRTKKLPGSILDTPRWNISEINYAVGLSPKKSSQEDIASVQGYHSEYLLVIMDEAAGMPKIMFDTIFNLATGSGNRILAIGNPIAQSGPFWDAFNSPTWHPIHMSCLDHPNVITGTEVIPGAVSREWVAGMVADHCIRTDDPGPDSIEWEGVWYNPDPVFQARVLGRAPDDSDSQLIPSSWVFSAQQMDLSPKGEMVIGLDPARSGGDDSTMICRQGGKIHWIKRRRPQTKDISGELAGWLAHEAIINDVQRIFIDEISWGVAVVDTCRRMGLPVIGVNVSKPATQKSRFANLRAELYWMIKDALKKNALALPDDDLLAADLIAPHYSFDHMGRILIEPKDEIRDRIGRSTDSGDALSLTFMLGDLSLLNDLYEYGNYEKADNLNFFQQESKWTVVNEILPGVNSNSSRWTGSKVGNRFSKRK